MPVNSIRNGNKELYAMLLGNLPTGISSSNVKFPNSPIVDKSGDAWLRATAIPTSTINTDATGCRQRTVGVLVINVFYRKGKGDDAAHLMAEELQQTFTNSNTNNVTIYVVDIVPRGEDGDWYHIQLDANYAHEGETR